MLAEFPAQAAEEREAQDKQPRVAIVGRPNVGKSTLVNALVGEERVIAFGEPGTTRDAIEVPFERGGRRYTLIDTAGLRKRGKQGLLRLGGGAVPVGRVTVHDDRLSLIGARLDPHRDPNATG